MEDSDLWAGLLWVVGCGVVVVVPVVFLVRALRRSAERAAFHEVHSLLHGIPIILFATKARLRGLRREWDGQWRGVGILALTEDGLYFRPTQRQVDLRIPLERITAVETKSSATGRRLSTRRLRVHYRGVDNTERVASWSGVEVEKWMDGINTLRECSGNG
ncbi:MAG: hypothetical protein AB9873_05595 [Syntrophobacteraceae bacterium]